MEGLVVVCWLQRRRGIGLFRYPRERVLCKNFFVFLVGNLTRVTRIKAQLVLFTGCNQKNSGLAEYVGSICYPRERVPVGTVYRSQPKEYCFDRIFWIDLLSP